MNGPNSQNLPPRTIPLKSYRSYKFKFSSGTSNVSKKESVKADLFADQEKIKTERKTHKLKVQEKQSRLQQELDKAEVLKNLEEAKNKLKLVKILDDIDIVKKNLKKKIIIYFLKKP